MYPGDGDLYLYSDSNNTICQMELEFGDDGFIYFTISSDPLYADYGYYCYDGWETSVYDMYTDSIEGAYGQQLFIHTLDSFQDLYYTLAAECASSDYDDYYNYDSYYSYGDSYDSYDYYYYDYYYGDSYYYEEEEQSAYDYLSGEWEYISEAYMGDGSIFIKATIATTAMIAAVSV